MFLLLNLNFFESQGKRRAKVAAEAAAGKGREAGVAIARGVMTAEGAAAKIGSAAAAGRDAAAVPGAGSVVVATELHCT